MRPAVAALALLAALTAPLAHAAPIDQIAISGKNSNGSTYTIDFNLNPAAPYNSNNNNNFDFSGIQGTIDGVNDTFSVIINPYSTYETFLLTDGGSLFQYLDISANNGVNVVSGTPNGTSSIITAGTYSGNNQTACISQVAQPFTRSMPTLAFFQIPTISPNCGAAVSLIVSPAAVSSVTPEPSTIALLGTGMLGIFGITRRRFFSKA